MKRTIGAVVAGVTFAIVGWVAGAGPASAHEGTVATVPVAPVAGAGELPGVDEYVPPPTAAAMTEATDRWSAPSVMVAATAVIAAGAAVVAVALRRRRVEVPWPGGLRLAGAGALLFTGVAHCALAPSHWAEGWHLGALFVASGLVLVGQAGLLWLRPSAAAYRSVLVSTAVLVVLSTWPSASSPCRSWTSRTPTS